MIDKILEFFFPSNIYCMACGNLINQTRTYCLCDNCMDEIKWIVDNSCSKCGKSLGAFKNAKNLCFECLDIDHEFTRGFSCTTYEGPVKEILSGLKYKGNAYYAAKMAGIMGDRALEFIEDLNVDMVIPVPMHRKKERKRGFNQAALLASEIADLYELEFKEDILVKRRDTSTMSSLSSDERRINLHNAFEIGYNNRNEIKGRRLLLIDDVYTTGSTADACTEVLNHNGATEVYIFTFAAGVNMKSKPN